MKTRLFCEPDMMSTIQSRSGAFAPNQIPGIHGYRAFIGALENDGTTPTGTIAAVLEVVGACEGWPGVEEAGDGGPAFVPGPGRGFAEQGLELGEELLDRVQIGTVGRQVEDGCAGRGERLESRLGDNHALIDVLSSLTDRGQQADGPMSHLRYGQLEVQVMELQGQERSA